MNRYLMRSIAAAAATLAGAIPASAGDRPGFGTRLYNAYDPCWPERCYSAVARQEVLAPFAQQALNGHVVNQTIWNYHFEPGTDRLTPAGVEKLDTLVRSRPAPDPRIYLQTARDLAANADTVDKLVASRIDLDAKRAMAVAKYMATQPRQMPYEVYVHDPADTSISAIAAGNAYRAQLFGYRGGITGSGGVNVSGAGGGQAPGAGASTGTGTGTGTGAPTGR